MRWLTDNLKLKRLLAHSWTQIQHTQVTMHLSHNTRVCTCVTIPITYIIVSIYFPLSYYYVCLRPQVCYLAAACVCLNSGTHVVLSRVKKETHFAVQVVIALSPQESKTIEIKLGYAGVGKCLNTTENSTLRSNSYFYILGCI